MSITRTILKVRPNAQVTFFEFSNKYKEKIDNDPNISRSHRYIDTYTLESVLTFSDQATFDAFFADPLVVEQITQLDYYCQLADIKVSRTDSTPTV
jgi:hypothetical protein